MTTKTSTEQERAEFEAWANGRCELYLVNAAGRYSSAITQFAWEAYQAGRAALQSQVKNDTTLFCDLKTDEEKSAFFLSGRGYETGVIALSIQNDVAMAYHRCAEYKKELEALQSQDKEDAARFRFCLEHGFPQKWEEMIRGSLRYYWTSRPGSQEEFSSAIEAIDHARRNKDTP